MAICAPFLLLSLCLLGEGVAAATPRDERFEVIVPRKVTSDGRFVSHQIPHHFSRSFYKNRARASRSPDDAVHYRFRIDGEEHHLELYPNHRLIAPGAIVEERRECNGTDPFEGTSFRRMRDAECHYVGNVRSRPEVSALSTCYGLVGYIRTGHGWYTIEPVAGHDFTKEAEHPHVVYKRGPGEWEHSQKTVEPLCRVSDVSASTVAKRAAETREKSVANTKGRAAAKEYTVELLVVLDKALLDHRRDFDAENYALTLFNMAAGLFRDASLGFDVELAIVRMIRLEVDEEQMNLSSNKDPDATLKYFEEWQRAANPGDDSHPNHHDCAVLLTKVDACATQPTLCGFTGASTVAGTCDPSRSAAVIADNNLQTGYHVAHHIGHTLGMSHDVEAENGCPGVVERRDGRVETTVMHPGRPYVTKRWSKCSRDYLAAYLESGMGLCLEDEPGDHHFPIVEMLPGVIYDGNDQCRLKYRQDVRQCDLGITCDTLRCAVPGKGCVSGWRPPADGTPCGDKRWCYEMKCRMIGERPGVTDGGWGAWSRWSKCSRSCGSGVAFSARKCDRPKPSKGGANCAGDRKRHKICATEPCQMGAPSFRDVQCAEFNDWIFPEDGKIHRWTAYNLPDNLKASENPCALYCQSETKLATSLRPKVVDGTTCYRGIRDVCIGGVCTEIPCDLSIESGAVEDACGVCKGDSTTCLLKEGTVTIGAQPNPRKIVDVPAGSRNVRVEETRPTRSRILVRTRARKVLIDGNRLGMFDVPGSKAWLGMIRARQEALNIPGPVTEDLVIMVQPKENVTLKYSMGVKQTHARRAEFSWDFLDWGKCTAGCGPGEQVSRPRCVERIGGLVDDSFCRHLARPDAKIRPCNDAPCIPRWTIGDWQGCTPCTTGCKMTRSVRCVRPVGRGEQDVDVIADSYCQGAKPRESEPCTTREKRDRRKVNRSVTNFHQSQDSRIRPFHEERSNESGDSARTGHHEVTRDEQDSQNSLEHDSGVRETKVESHEPFSTRETSFRWTSGKVVGGGGVGREKGVEKRQEGDMGPRKIDKGRVVVDKEDVDNLTLTIILERDEDNNVVNFPKDFKPQPLDNSTEFTLVGMDAVRYVERIRKDALVTIPAPPF